MGTAANFFQRLFQRRWAGHCFPLRQQPVLFDLRQRQMLFLDVTISANFFRDVRNRHSQ